MCMRDTKYSMYDDTILKCFNTLCHVQEIKGTSSDEDASDEVCYTTKWLLLIMLLDKCMQQSYTWDCSIHGITNLIW